MKGDTVHILEATYDHEPSTLIAVYANKLDAEKKQASLKKAQERYQRAVARAVDKDTEIKAKCPAHVGGSIDIVSIKLK